MRQYVSHSQTSLYNGIIESHATEDDVESLEETDTILTQLSLNNQGSDHYAILEDDRQSHAETPEGILILATAVQEDLPHEVSGDLEHDITLPASSQHTEGIECHDVAQILSGSVENTTSPPGPPMPQTARASIRRLPPIPLLSRGNNRSLNPNNAYTATPFLSHSERSSMNGQKTITGADSPLTIDRSPRPAGPRPSSPRSRSLRTVSDGRSMRSWTTTPDSRSLRSASTFPPPYVEYE